MRSAIVFVLGLFLLLTMSVAHVGCLCRRRLPLPWLRLQGRSRLARAWRAVREGLAR